MTAQILAAKPLVDQAKGELTRRCESLKNRGVHPSMAVVLVGDNPASLSYIRNKKKLCEEVGAKFELHQFSSGITAEEFLGQVKAINEDPAVHGIIVQLPVSEELRKLDIANLVRPEKDIDGFHEKNTQKLYRGSRDLTSLLPCTPKGVIHLLAYYGIPVQGKEIVMIGRSLIVGKPLSMLLTNMDATVTLAHARTQNLSELTNRADIVISAIGVPHFLDATYFNPAKKTVVIDVGMNSLDGKLVGDVNTLPVSNLVAAISPVPGGVGPMTVLSLIDNLMTATELSLKGQ